MIAALSGWHEQHAHAAAALEKVDVLPAHVFIEAYSVLTRLPSGLAVSPGLAAETLLGRFPRPPLGLADDQRAGVLGVLARAGVHGGASYDGLIALEANAHGQTLTTLDARAQSTYRRLGTTFTVIPR